MFIDCCDNGSRFGDIRQMGVEDLPGFGWAITVGNRIITNVPMEETLTKEETVREDFCADGTFSFGYADNYKSATAATDGGILGVR